MVNIFLSPPDKSLAVPPAICADFPTCACLPEESPIITLPFVPSSAPETAKISLPLSDIEKYPPT